MGQRKLHLPPPFEEIMERYEREIMRYLLRVSADREDAADLFQETWLRAYRAYSRLASVSGVRPWLYAIATNLWRNRIRDAARRPRTVVVVRSQLSAPDRLAKNRRFDHENEGYAAIHMRELINDLPTKQQQALHLRYFAGLGYAAIARALGCSTASARANVSQAMRKLKGGW